MSYKAIEITKPQADQLVKDDFDAFKNADEVRYFTYADIAAANLTEGTYSKVILTELQNMGTLPIDPRKPQKPMFPR